MTSKQFRRRTLYTAWDNLRDETIFSGESAGSIRLAFPRATPWPTC